MIEEPTFLICSERSGSNLIRSMMDAHSKIYAPMPLHLGRNFWLRIDRYGDLNVDSNWSDLTDELARGISTLPGGFPLAADELRQHVKARNFKDLYLYIYERGMKEAGKTHLFIKEVHTWQQVFFLLHYFPKAKFVLQVRDPRDYIVSCKNSGIQFSRIPKQLELWQRDQIHSLEVLYTLEPSRVFTQRYEDLLADPERVLRSLCTFMGLEFDPQMLKFNETKEAKVASTRNRAWRNLAKPLMKDNSKKYLRELSPIEIKYIEYRVGKLMRRFGYALENPSEPGPIDQALLKVYEREPLRWLATVREKMNPWRPKEERERRQKSLAVAAEIERKAQQRELAVRLGYEESPPKKDTGSKGARAAQA